MAIQLNITALDAIDLQRQLKNLVEQLPAQKSKHLLAKKSVLSPRETPKAQAKSTATEEVVEPATEEEAAFTRDDLKALIKEMHEIHGDDFLPKIQNILKKYGARKQSEVKDEDVIAVYAEIEAVA